jgi:4-amino-4-deoxy-L-arabinose transferase-like glycosyltransferase
MGDATTGDVGLQRMTLAALFLLQLAALAALTIVSWLVGRAVTRLPLRGPVERFTFFVGAGLGTLGVVLFLLGLVGWLIPMAVVGLAAAALLLGFVPPFVPPNGVDGRGSSWAPLSWRRGLAVTGIVVFPAFVLSLYPPTAYDETMYHLPFASAFAATHRLAVVPEHLFPVYPQLLELLFSGMLMVSGDVSTHVVQFLCMLATAAAVFAICERFGDRRAAVLGVALWLSNPLVHYQAASAYVDLGYTLFTILAILAFEAWRDTDSRRWIAASGILVGFAAGTKYLGLIWLGMLVLATWASAPRGRRLARAALFTVMALASMAPWYLRNAVVTGNPIFPLIAGWVRSANRPAGAAWAGSASWVSDNTLAGLRHPWDLIALPWRVAFDRARFDFQSPLSPWYLVVLPIMAWQALRDPRFRRWLLFIVVYAVVGPSYDLRFQIPSAALLSAGGGIALVRVLDRTRQESLRNGRYVAVLALLLAVLGPAYAAYKVVRHGVPPSTSSAREKFLSRELPGYDVVSALNRSCGATYTLFAVADENLAYYSKGRFLGQPGGPFARVLVEPLLNDAERLRAVLSGWRVDYLSVGLTPRPGFPDVQREDPLFRRSFHSVLRTSTRELYVLEDEGRPRSLCLPERSGVDVRIR